MTAHRIAVIAGDGIGNEVMPEGLRVVEAAAHRYGIPLEFTTFDWAHCGYYQKHGQMMPADWREQLSGVDAIYFGAVGWPEAVPCPLANRKVGDIDFYVVRENTEGEYCAIGGRLFEGTERETVIQESIFTRKGVDRILKYAFGLASKRPKKHLTSATKSNGVAISMPYWDERVEAMAGCYPDVRWDKYHIDILTARFVLSPERFDGVVASHLFGDFLGNGDARYTAAHDGVLRAIEATLADGPRTPDMGGNASTTDVGRAVAEAI